MRFCNNCKQNVSPKRQVGALYIGLMLFVGFIFYIFLAGFYYFAPSSAAGSGFVVLFPLVIMTIMYFVRSKTCPMCKGTEWGTQSETSQRSPHGEWHSIFDASFGKGVQSEASQRYQRCEFCGMYFEKEVEKLNHYPHCEKKSDYEKKMDDEKRKSMPYANIIRDDVPKKDVKDKQSISQKFKTSPVLQGSIIGLIATVIFWSIIFSVSSNSLVMGNDALEPDLMKGDLIKYLDMPLSSLKENDIVAFDNPSGEFQVKVGKVRKVVNEDPIWIQTSNNVNPSIVTKVTQEEFIGKIITITPQIGPIFSVLRVVGVQIGITAAFFLVPIVVLKLRKKTRSKNN